MQPARAALPEFDPHRRDHEPAPIRRHRHFLTRILRLQLGPARFQNLAIRMTSLWCEAHAASRLPRGRDLKYASDSARGIFDASPAIVTCRSWSGQ